MPVTSTKFGKTTQLKIKKSKFSVTFPDISFFKCRTVLVIVKKDTKKKGWLGF